MRTWMSIRTTVLVACGVVALLAPGCGKNSTARSAHDEEEHGDHEAAGKAVHGKRGDGHGHREEAGKGGGHGKREAGHPHDEEQVVSLPAKQLAEFGVKLGTAGPGAVSVRLRLTGEVVLNPNRVAHLVPSLSGIARTVRKQVGDAVQQGELMAVLASRELSGLNAEYLAAQAKSSLAWVEYQREKRLYVRGVSSQQAYQRARLAMSRAYIGLQLARRKLFALGFTRRDLSRIASRGGARLSRYELRAPFDGVVVDKHISQGEFLKADSQAFTVADLSTVWVRLKVYQKDLALVQPGHRVRITAAYGKLQADAQIAYVSPIVSPATRTASARVVLQNKKGQWRPGLFVNGLVEVQTLRAPVVVPRTALIREGDGVCIFVREEKGFRCRPVVLGVGDARAVSVRSGLEAGERYVRQGGFTLKAQLEKASFGGGHSH